jgi:hypothetical protein
VADKRLADLRRRYRLRVKQFRYARGRIHKLRAVIAKRKRQLQGTGGAKALKVGLSVVGRTERNNRAPWLDRWARHYVGSWMVGQPWCGLFCIVCWAHAGKKLPKDTVSTVAIYNRARNGNGYRSVRSSQAKAGDLVVMDFGAGGPPAQHVGLALGPAKGGVIRTVEGNTSPGNGGSQANGGGIYRRTRPLGVVRVIARPL